MPHTHNIVDDDNRFIINSETRDISNASGNKITLMQYDHNSERFTFELPRSIEGHDVRQCDLIEIKFQNVGSGTSASLRPVISDSYRVTDVSVDSENSDRATFTWLLGKTATQYAGTLSFQIKFACYEDPESGTYSFVWHTNKYTNIAINAGLDVDEALETTYPSVLERMTARLDNIENQAVQTFDLVSLGMPDILLDGGTVKLDTDTTEILDALLKGPAKFIVNVSYNGLQFPNVPLMVIPEGQSCVCVFSFPGAMYMFMFVVTDGAITAGAKRIQEALPNITTDDNGKILRAIDGEWVLDGGVVEKVTTLEKAVEDILYDEISITSFSNNVGTAEKGSTVTSVSLSWAFNKVPATVTLDGETQGTGQNGKIDLTGLSITSNKTWTLAATDERKAHANKTTTITFLNGVYYGVAAYQDSYDSAFIIALGKSGNKTLRSSKLSSFKVTVGTGQYIYYCQPKSFDACTFTVGGFDGGFDLVATLTYTNEHEHQEEYYIYRSTNAGLGETTVGVK